MNEKHIIINVIKIIRYLIYQLSSSNNNNTKSDDVMRSENRQSLAKIVGLSWQNWWTGSYFDSRNRPRTLRVFLLACPISVDTSCEILKWLQPQRMLILPLAAHHQRPLNGTPRLRKPFALLLDLDISVQSSRKSWSGTK